MMITPEQFLDITKNKKPDKIFRLAIIDSGYTEGKPRVVFDGESKPTAKRYTYLDSYTPKPGDRVLMAYLSGSYVILGKII